MHRFLALLLAVSTPAAASAAVLRLTVFDDDGRPLDTKGLLRYIAPASKAESGIAPEESGIFLTDLEGLPAAGRPWLDRKSESPALEWKDPERVRLSLPWPVERDGFSTVLLDSGGKGYGDGQEILLNEEIAVTAYRRMQDSLRERTGAWDPPYKPSKQVLRLVERAKKSMVDAHAASSPRKRAKRFDKALVEVSSAWSQLLFENGLQLALDPKHSKDVRWGLSLDETLVDHVKDYDWIAGRVADSGADWVRLVFRSTRDDFTFSRKSSFTLYDEIVDKLSRRNLKIMGSVLDSVLWPKDITVEDYRKRAENLATHYKGGIRCWEVASEPNGDWLGGEKTHVRDETILLAVQKAVVAVKKADRSNETVATIHWWEGTAGDDHHAMTPWLQWAAARGFGTGVDVIGLSLYPHRHPVGVALEPAFRELQRFFPGKKLMLAGFSFGETGETKPKGYWWLVPGSVSDANKDLISLYSGAAIAMPESLGGGFFWLTLGGLMDPAAKKTTPLYRVYRETLKRFKP